MSWRAALIMCCWMLAIGDASAGESTDPAAGDPVRSALRETPPLWYDNERDGWRLIVLCEPVMRRFLIEITMPQLLAKLDCDRIRNCVP